jgi:ribosomal protein S18 acetylase RimI-like enzyme
MKIMEMTIEDYGEVFALWRSSKGIGLHDDVDSKDGIAGYLQRNCGLSFVARQGDRVVGAVLCGHDGRRGYLHHLAVDAEYRKKGIGKALVEQVIAKLQKAGIHKCHIFVFADNDVGRQFWGRIGWSRRDDLRIMSYSTMTENIDCC